MDIGPTQDIVHIEPIDEQDLPVDELIIPFHEHEIVRFEMGRRTVVEGAAVHPSHVNLYVDGERIRGVRSMALIDMRDGRTGLAVVVRYEDQLVDMMQSGDDHRIQLNVTRDDNVVTKTWQVDNCKITHIQGNTPMNKKATYRFDLVSLVSQPANA